MTTTTTAAPRKRHLTKKGVIIGVAIVVALATAAAAVYFATARITGGGSTKTLTASWSGTPTSTANTTTEIKTAPSITSGNLGLPNNLAFWPGEVYEFRANVGTVGSMGYVSGLHLPDLGAGYEARIVAGCGTIVGEGTNAFPVTVQIKALDNASGSWTLTTNSGVQVTPTSSGTLGGTKSGVTCPVYSGQ
jgi:hypothetical protein